MEFLMYAATGTAVNLSMGVYAINVITSETQI